MKLHRILLKKGNFAPVATLLKGVGAMLPSCTLSPKSLADCDPGFGYATNNHFWWYWSTERVFEF